MQSIYGMKSGSQYPTYYLMGIGIGYQMQVAHSVFQFYIGNVSYPNLIGTRYNYSFYQVLVFMETVIAVRRAATF
jgi:hypothetical protein